MLTHPVETTVPRLSLDDCRRPGSPFYDQVRAAALGNGLEPRALTVRTLLHLPRIARHNGSVSQRQIETELRFSGNGLRADQAEIKSLIPFRQFALQDLRFVEYESGRAAEVFSRLHYLRSARPGSRNFALVDPVDGLPVSLCSVSPLEWMRVGRQLNSQFGVPRERAWDISRVYSFDVAPKNAISYLLARVRTVFRIEMRDVDLLTTAVDPNLGFTGASYRSANWQHWMSIQARPYLYVDRRYASPRQLRERFGTANLVELKARPGVLVEQSRAKLLDSRIFCCRVRGETESVPLDDLRVLRR
ncbi:hypothetical protein EV138_0143 [Kribbella voronezhensis]|uniref:Uncharacterized protein n=1 Tax=Kribbella voronezhensis TaxID=2512212 RepID=A0A4R7T542_9ACTN|nr:hypothetical protein [Kribbella voronezhensis]TDU86629.1 hypothetical protein EV138_0143 [Kribbella voronezhensis]